MESPTQDQLLNAAAHLEGECPEVAAMLQGMAEQPVVIPDWPESESLADLEYAQNTPEGWDAEYKREWQDLQVALRNNSILRRYARELRELIAFKNPQPPTQPQAVEPVDMVLVPLNPTPEQIKAGDRAAWPYPCAQIYKAMLDAALTTSRQPEQTVQPVTNCRRCGGPDTVLCGGQCKKGGPA